MPDLKLGSNICFHVFLILIKYVWYNKLCILRSDGLLKQFLHVN